MDIRGPRLRKPSDEALAYTSSMAADVRIARHVVEVNMAHMAALISASEVDSRTGAKCIRFLLGISPEVPGDSKAEDFHQLLEQMAVDELGVQTAGFLNYGKSRNDQVATAIRMELRLRLISVLQAIAKLQRALLGQIKRSGTMVMPGYTHLQHAQPVTVGHHLIAHFDALQRDKDRVLQLYRRVNLSPMGGAAMAGTSVKIDRRLVAGSLGFSGIVRNAMDAVSSRDVAVEALSCATITMLDASRLAEELILWSSVEFDFVELADEYSASSSIMPQKKNAVTAETVRAKAGTVLGELTAVCAITKSLPYSYNLDLQEATPHLWRALDDTIESLNILAGTVSSASFKAESLREAIADDNSTAVALANFLVKEYGISFRRAHSLVGELVRISAKTGKPLSNVVSSKLKSVSAKSGRKIEIEKAKVEEILDPRNFIGSIATEGGSNPGFLAQEISKRKGELSRTRSDISRLQSSIKSSQRKLHAKASGLAREVKSKD
jgi:argininosuccinate lyase